jgi:hypothetical protein
MRQTLRSGLQPSQNAKKHPDEHMEIQKVQLMETEAVCNSLQLSLSLICKADIRVVRSLTTYVSYRLVSAASPVRLHSRCKLNSHRTCFDDDFAENFSGLLIIVLSLDWGFFVIVLIAFRLLAVNLVLPSFCSLLARCLGLGRSLAIRLTLQNHRQRCLKVI